MFAIFYLLEVRPRHMQEDGNWAPTFRGMGFPGGSAPSENLAKDYFINSVDFHFTEFLCRQGIRSVPCRTGERYSRSNYYNDCILFTV